MTIHAAKGLEFPCVFVAGLEEGLFPNAMAINTREELEEERRLFYVAITRAKSRLWLTYANTRYRFGSLVQNEPSRFLEEMSSDYLDRSYAGSGVRNTMGSPGRNTWRSGDQERIQRKTMQQPVPRSQVNVNPVKKIIAHTPSPNFIADDPSDFEAGMEIEHLKFGFGKILRLEGNANNRISTIFFPEGGGEKKIMLNYAKLRIVRKNE
jgi:DNA helicase-2/ATP-dependent DNA helicase PcrA